MIRSHGAGRWGAGLVAVLAMIGALVTVALAGSAQAAVHNRWGFALVTSPAWAGTPRPADQAGSWPAPFRAEAEPGRLGSVVVRFPQIGIAGGVVHVTAVASGPAWCQAQWWRRSGPDELVSVRCYRAGGRPDFVPFAVMFTQSSRTPFPPGRAYGYLHYQPGRGIVSGFSSTGAADVVTRLSTGLWRVTLPGLGSPELAGNLQVTPVDPDGPAKCEVSGWASARSAQLIRIRCYGAGTGPLDTGWTLSYQRDKALTGSQSGRYAYTFGNKPAAAGPYLPDPVTVNFNSDGAGSTVTGAGPGQWLIIFPLVGQAPSTVQVTPFGTGGGFCNLVGPWSTSGADGPAAVTLHDVACYTAAGQPATVATFVSYAAAH
jgi:hypothetical protein